MKRTITLILFLLSSIVGFSQSISSVSPIEIRRNSETWFDINGSGTLFTQSSSLVVSLKSNVDGSVITSMNFWPGADEWCSGSMMIPETATPGLYSLSILTSNQGKLTLANAVTVTNQIPAPKFIQLTPTSATNGQQVAMTIQVRFGQFSTTSMLQVNMSGTTTYLTADSIEVINDSTLIAVFNIPANNQSDVCYIVVNTDTEYIFCYQAFDISGIDPAIVSISPNSASDGEQVDITLHTTQTYFTSASSISVSLEGGWIYEHADSITVVNDSVLIASFFIPIHTRSNVCDVAVVVDGVGFRMFGGFTINGANPVLLGINPAEGEQGTTLDVTISGVDMFFNDASNISVSFYSPAGGFFDGSSPVALSDNQLKTTLDIPTGAPAGLYSLYLNVDGNNYELYDAFNVIDDGMPDPGLVSISPDTAERGQTVNVIIKGYRTQFTQSFGLVVTLVGNEYYQTSDITVLNDTTIRCTFDFPPTAGRGVYDLYVSEQGFYMFLEKVFTIVGTASDPVLVSISPGMTFPGQALDITITGANTHFMASSSNLDIAIYNQSTSVFVQASSITATSNTTLVAHFEIPIDFPLGIYDLGLFSDIDGFLDLIQSVIVNAVGLDENEQVITNLYPNPVHDNLYIDTKYPVRACTIVDITGKQTIIDPNEFKQDNTHIMVPIDKLGLRKGIYFIRLDSDNGFDYKKFVVE